MSSMTQCAAVAGGRRGRPCTGRSPVPATHRSSWSRVPGKSSGESASGDTRAPIGGSGETRRTWPPSPTPAAPPGGRRASSIRTTTSCFRAPSSWRPAGSGPELRKGDCAALTILNMQVTSTLLVPQAGGTQVVMDRSDPPAVAQWIRSEKVNAWFGVPTLLQGLARSDEVAPEDLASLSDVWTGGTFLPSPTRAEFETRFGRRPHATYGLTEVPTIATIEDRGEPPLRRIERASTSPPRRRGARRRRERAPGGSTGDDHRPGSRFRSVGRPLPPHARVPGQRRSHVACAAR